MASNTSRTMIAALQVSLDGFIEGPDGEKDWADSWASAIELIPDVDTFVLGGRMYPGYGEYWNRSTPILSVSRHSRSECPRRAKSPTPGWLQRHPTSCCPGLSRAFVARGADHPGCHGAPNPQGATREEHLCRRRGNPRASLLNGNLIDELRLIVHPEVLGKGQALFSGVNKRLSLDLVQARSTESGRVILTYRIGMLRTSRACRTWSGARGRTPMTTHLTGAHNEWLAARLELLKAEKELTRRSDELARRRRSCHGFESTRSIDSRPTRGALRWLTSSEGARSSSSTASCTGRTTRQGVQCARRSRMGSTGSPCTWPTMT